MDLTTLKNQIHKMTFEFWDGKARIENDGGHHILDNLHFNQTLDKLINILPTWKTYRNAQCDWRKELPRSLKHIVESYDQIRKFSLLDFNDIPKTHLENIWNELGRVKEPEGQKRPEGDYYLIAVCKPLLFLWGQTPALDSINRKNIRNELNILSYKPVSSNRPRLYHRVPLYPRVPSTSRWSFEDWRELMKWFQKQLNDAPDIKKYCTEEFHEWTSKNELIPWGRYLDIYYYK